MTRRQFRRARFGEGLVGAAADLTAIKRRKGESTSPEAKNRAAAPAAPQVRMKRIGRLDPID
jgi:hypothetical protein